MNEFPSEKLRDLIETSTLSYRQNSCSFIFTCPRCEKKDKLYVRKTDGRFVCFVCAEGEGHFRGACEYALAELLGWSVGEVRHRLYGHDFEGKTIEDLLDIQLYDFYGDEDEIEEDVTSTIPTTSWPADSYPIDAPASNRGARYLEAERGVPVLLAKAYGVRYCPPTRRVVFPVTAQGRLIGWQARSIIPTEWVGTDGKIYTSPKIVGNKGLRREISVMFEDRLRGSKHAVICEGPLDGIKAHLCGGNVVTMGKAVSDAQIKIIRRSGVQKVYLAIDPDAAAEMERLAHEFGDLEVYQVLPARGKKDLGEMTPLEVLEQFQKACRVDSGTCFVYLRF